MCENQGHQHWTSPRRIKRERSYCKSLRLTRRGPELSITRGRVKKYKRYIKSNDARIGGTTGYKEYQTQTRRKGKGAVHRLTERVVRATVRNQEKNNGYQGLKIEAAKKKGRKRSGAIAVRS